MSGEGVGEIKPSARLLSCHPRFARSYERPKIKLEIQWCMASQENRQPSLLPRGVWAGTRCSDSSPLSAVAFGGKHAGRGLLAEGFSAVQPRAACTSWAGPAAPHELPTRGLGCNELSSSPHSFSSAHLNPARLGGKVAVGC